MEHIKNSLLAVLAGVAALALLIGIGFGLNYVGLIQFRFFAPRAEQVRYDTFKQSQAYNDGMLTDLEDIQREYLSATPEQKITLRELALHRFAAYPQERMPADLQAFYASLKAESQLSKPAGVEK